MSIDMEQAEPYGDIAQFEQEGYHLDLDVGVDANDIDLQVETFDTEAQFQTPATDPATGFAKQTGDIDIGYDEEDMGVDDHQDQAESTHHQELDADVNGIHVDVEYEDEIGYDEDDDSGDDGAAGTAAEPDVSAPQTSYDEPKLDDELQELNHNENTSDFYHDDASLHTEHAGQGSGNHVAALDGSTSDGHDSDLAAALTNPQEQSASSISELERIDELSGETPEAPCIEVRYKENTYFLFGSPEDDPDAYFLSEPKHLDISLYEFLVAIRNVVEDELSSHDELSIRIPSLALEFGERSSQSFLRAYSFREIHDCWTRLFPDGVEGSLNLVLHLAVCHDPEYRFSELLAQAELPRTSALLEGPDEHSDNQAAIGFDDEGRDGNGIPDSARTTLGNFGANSEDEPALVNQAESSQPVTGAQENTSHGAQNEEDTNLEVASFQVNSLQILPDGAHPLTEYEGFDLSVYPEEDGQGKEEEYGYLNEHHMADSDEEVREEGDNIEDQEFPEADDDVSPEADDNFEDGDIVADVEVTATGETEVSVIGAGVETSEFYDDQEINIDLGEDPSLAPNEPRAYPDSHEDTTELNGHRDNNSAAPTDQQDSNHTSATSTVDGDEIDYEDHGLEDDDFSLNAENQQQLHLEAEERDEIDWEDDEDDAEAAVLPAAESPSSVSAKRSRTDDGDILVDEAGMGALPSSSSSSSSFLIGADNETGHKRRRT